MTAANGKIPLLGRLAKGYPDQARNLTSGTVFIRVDDRDSDDTYPGFCDIHLKMSAPDADKFTLVLDNVPFDDDLKTVAEDLKTVAEELDGTWHTTRTGERLALNLSAENSGNIRELAKAISNVVGRGKRYLDANWNWNWNWIAIRSAVIKLRGG